MPPNINLPKAPTLNNSAGGSSESRAESFQKSIAQASTVRAAADNVLRTREDLAKYLAQSGLQLRTKYKTFSATRDFLSSSYVVYPQHRGQQEPLTSFIERYPQIKQYVLDINDRLKQ